MSSARRFSFDPRACPVTLTTRLTRRCAPLISLPVLVRVQHLVCTSMTSATNEIHGHVSRFRTHHRAYYIRCFVPREFTPRVNYKHQSWWGWYITLERTVNTRISFSLFSDNLQWINNLYNIYYNSYSNLYNIIYLYINNYINNE